jgi:hypothetical protein
MRETGAGYVDAAESQGRAVAIGLAPETEEPAATVAISEGTSGCGGCPASSAARNGETSGRSMAEDGAGGAEVVEEREIDAPATKELAAAASELAAEDMT